MEESKGGGGMKLVLGVICVILVTYFLFHLGNMAEDCEKIGGAFVKTLTFYDCVEVRK